MVEYTSSFNHHPLRSDDSFCQSGESEPDYLVKWVDFNNFKPSITALEKGCN